MNSVNSPGSVSTSILPPCCFTVFRRGVSAMIGVGVPSLEFNEIKGLKGSRGRRWGQFSISIHIDRQRHGCDVSHAER